MAGFIEHASAIRRAVIIDVMADKTLEPHPPNGPPGTWNDPMRIAAHRSLTPSERVRLTIEASRAALLFAAGRRVDER